MSHIIELDPESGKRVREHPGQGYALGTQWSRGQAWGLYGFALAYRHLGEGKYLDAAIRIARKCMRIVYENIIFAIGVKAVCLLLSALGMAGMGLAVFADVGVMIIAVLNAIRALFTGKERGAGNGERTSAASA